MQRDTRTLLYSEPPSSRTVKHGFHLMRLLAVPVKQSLKWKSDPAEYSTYPTRTSLQNALEKSVKDPLTIHCITLTTPKLRPPPCLVWLH